jgi:hypothetical protein
LLGISILTKVIANSIFGVYVLILLLSHAINHTSTVCKH